MYKKILVPLDGSELSEAALAHAHALASALGAEIVLLHVVVFVNQGLGSPIVLSTAPRCRSS
jgi:nucleotide-binding universal stress UspA family protein